MHRNSNLKWPASHRFPLDNPVGNLLVKAAAAFQHPGARSYLRTNIGRKFEIDTSKIRSELGMTFRPVEEAIVDTYRDLRRWGHITA